MINKAMDYLQQLFLHLADLDYHLSDLEASSFIPYLVLKVKGSVVCFAWLIAVHILIVASSVSLHVHMCDVWL